MANKPGQVTKIYQLKTIGYADVSKDLKNLAKQFDEVAKAKAGYEKEKRNVNNDAEIKRLNDLIKEQTKREKELTLEIKKQNEERKKKDRDLSEKIAEQTRKEKELTLEIKRQNEERKKRQLAEKLAANKDFSAGFAENSINKARAENKKLREERGNLNEQLEADAKRIKEINDEIDRNDELIKRNSSNLEKRKINIGNYEGSAKIIVDALERIRIKTAQAEQQFGKFSPEAQAARRELDALERVTGGPQFLNVAAKFGDASAEVKFFTKAVIDLEKRGFGSSEVVKDLKLQLANLTDQIGDTKEEIKALSSDTRSFDLVASGISSFTSAIQTGIGVSALFGDSQEEVSEKLVFLSAVENTANGIRAIATDLTTRGTAANKVYAFFQNLTAKAFDKTAASAVRAAAATKLFLLSATGIGAIILIFSILSKKMSDAERNQKNLNAAIKEGGSEYAKAIQQVQELRTNIDLAKKGFVSKKEVVDKYNETIGQTTGEVKNLDEAEKALIKNGDAYIEMMFKKAIAAAALAKASQLAVDQQLALIAGPSTLKTKDGKEENAGIAGDINFFAKEQFQKDQADFKKDIKGLMKFYTDTINEAAGISKKFGFDFFGTKDDKNKSNPTKDALNLIDAARDTAVAKENERYLELKKTRELTLEEEIDHLQKLEQINLKAIDDKKAYFGTIKKLDAEQNKQVAQLGADRVDIEIKTFDDIQKLRDEEFNKLQTQLKNQFDENVKRQQEYAEDAENDPTLSEEKKAEIKLESDQDILALQEEFNKAMEILERLYKQNSIQNAQERADAIKEINRKLREDEKKLALARLEDLNKSAENEMSKMRTEFSKQRRLILENDKLTKEQKEKALEKLNKAQNLTILSAELILLNKQVEEKKKLLDKGLISQEEYQRSVEAAAAKAEEVAQATLDKTSKKGFSIKNLFRSLFGIEEGSDLDGVLGDILTQAYDVALQAMNNFYDAEQQRIRDSLDLQLERLEQEKEQVTARAQTQAEIDSLEKQYAAKKKKAEQEAGERLKKSKRAEAKIALATELANIAVSAASNPANGVTFGAAGAIMYGILSGLALARYAMNVSAINREKFEFGGKPGEVPTRGGKFGGRTHSQGGTDFSFKGNQYNAEVNELAVVRTKNARANKTYTVTGTQMQLASAANVLGGGINFRPGAKLSRFDNGGYLGDSLQAPAFTPSATLMVGNGGVSEAKMNEYMDRIEDLANEQSKRIDRIEVVQKTSTVTDAQKKQVKQSNIGTL